MDTEAASEDAPAPAPEADTTPAAPVTEEAAAPAPEAEAKIDEWNNLWLKTMQSICSFIFTLNI